MLKEKIIMKLPSGYEDTRLFDLIFDMLRLFFQVFQEIFMGLVFAMLFRLE
jgi:hypothetical protein